jgi:hypothetical protein
MTAKFLAGRVGEQLKTSMIWFGSSAGLAISGIFPGAKSVGARVRGGWFVAADYLERFAIILTRIGWHPDPREVRKMDSSPSSGSFSAGGRARSKLTSRGPENSFIFF